jgi:hypothetical protein
MRNHFRPFYNHSGCLLISLLPSVPVCLHERDSVMNFHYILYWEHSLIYVSIYQFELKSDSNNGHSTWRATGVSARILCVTLYISVRKKNVSNKRYTEKKNILDSTQFFNASYDFRDNYTKTVMLCLHFRICILSINNGLLNRCQDYRRINKTHEYYRSLLFRIKIFLRINL